MPKNKIIFNKFIGFSFFVILIDQLFKTLTQKFWPNILLCNSQMALGLPKINWLYWLSYLIIFFLLLNLIKKNPTNVTLFLILGGAVSNLFDRLFLGCVIDWISIFSFPVFNLADLVIFLGTLFFVYQQFKKTKFISEI